MRLPLLFSLFVFSLLTLSFAAADVYDDVADVALQEDAGLTPDSAFYFVDLFVEDLFVGDNPYRALAYKEEKIVEAQEMIAKGDIDAAQKALELATQYGSILEKEVSPELEQRALESSKAVQHVLDDFDDELVGDEWGAVRDLVADASHQEESIAYAAKISVRIETLCARLSLLDPLAYADVCKTDDDAPEWHKELDRDLTAEQQREAEAFSEILSTCFADPATCRCEDISVVAFAEQCHVVAPLASACMDGDTQACVDLENNDLIELLPDYLQEVMHDVERQYADLYPEHSLDEACIDAEIFDEDACEEYMFDSHAPQPCIDEGITTPDACREFMDEFDQPDAPLGVACHDIDSAQDRLACYDDAASGQPHEEEHSDEFLDSWPASCTAAEIFDRAACKALMDEEHHDEQDLPEDFMDSWPAPCAAADIFDHAACEDIMDDYEGDEGFVEDHEDDVADPEDHLEEDSCGEGEIYICDHAGCFCHNEEEYFSTYETPEDPWEGACSAGEVYICDDSGCSCRNEETYFGGEEGDSEDVPEEDPE